MKIIGVEETLCHNQEGSIQLIPEDAEDIWSLNKLIVPGDVVETQSYRKVARESFWDGDMDICFKDTNRVLVELEIRVKSTEYDGGVPSIHVRGVNLTQSEYVAVGQHHSFTLGLRKALVLSKPSWDSLSLDMLKESALPRKSANLAVLLMHEGLANIMFVGGSITETRCTVREAIPRKHGLGGYETALKSFFTQVATRVLRYIDFGAIGCLVIASPGFTATQFRERLLEIAEERGHLSVIENKSRILVVKADSGYKHSLMGVLADPSVMRQIKDSKAAKEARALGEFWDKVRLHPDCACYGPRHVEVAQERLAIRTLLVTDALVRSVEAETREKYMGLVESVKKAGGDVCVFSTMHESGQQLATMTGVAAILRFPLVELDEIDFDVTGNVNV